MFQIYTMVDISKSFGKVLACEWGLFFTNVQTELRKDYFENTKVIVQNDVSQMFKFAS